MTGVDNGVWGALNSPRMAERMNIPAIIRLFRTTVAENIAGFADCATRSFNGIRALRLNNATMVDVLTHKIWLDPLTISITSVK